MMHNNPKIESNFRYHPVKDQAQAELYESIRSHIRQVAYFIDEHVPEGREKALAMTKLEEVMFWSNAGVARNG